MARKLGVESTDGCRFQAGVVAACLRERGVVHMDGVVNYDASKDVLQQQRLAFEGIWPPSAIRRERGQRRHRLRLSCCSPKRSSSSMPLGRGRHYMSSKPSSLRCKSISSNNNWLSRLPPLHPCISSRSSAAARFCRCAAASARAARRHADFVDSDSRVCGGGTCGGCWVCDRGFAS